MGPDRSPPSLTIRMKPALLLLLSALGAVLPPAFRSGDGGETPVGIGDEVGRIRFTDLRYLPRSLEELAPDRVSVLVFTSTTCPVARRYLPRLRALEEEYRGRGVAFLGVDVGTGSTVVEVAAQAVEHGLAFPLVKDFDGSVAKAVGATRTPEVCVLDAGRVLRYRGRVDSQYRVGGVAPTPGREDLREALEDVLAGREVAVAETPVDGCRIAFPVESAPPENPPTWSADVAPLVKRLCQDCHRTGGESPFPLETLADVAERADTVVEVVREGRMPPWFASPDHGEFVNARTVTDEERRLLFDWIRAGFPPGDPGEVPEPLPPPESRWKIGTPDKILKAPFSVKLPAEGYVPYKYTVLPFVFKEDTWLQAIQILPENPRVLHHANLVYYQIGQSFEQGNFITGQVPGGSPMQLDPGTGVLIPKGSVLALQMHYVTTGVEERDRISVGLVYPREPIQKQLHHVQVRTSRFAIPPGDPAHEVRTWTLSLIHI